MAVPHSDLYSAWYDASDAATVTADGSNLVSQWDDKSGNARHATQATASLKPRFSSVANGLKFDGSNDYLACSIPSRYAFVALSHGFVNPDIDVVFDDGTGNNCLRILDTDTYRVDSAGTYNNNDYTYQGGRCWINGTPTNTYAGPATPHVVTVERGDHSSSLGTNITMLGGGVLTNRVFQGWLHEVIFVDSALTNAQITAITDYLVGRWTLPAAASSRTALRSPFLTGRL